MHETNTPPPRWNWQERARRAEAIAERLAACLSVRVGWPNRGDRCDYEAIVAWAAHRADLDTLAQRGECEA